MGAKKVIRVGNGGKAGDGARCGHSVDFMGRCQLSEWVQTALFSPLSPSLPLRQLEKLFLHLQHPEPPHLYQLDPWGIFKPPD